MKFPVLSNKNPGQGKESAFFENAKYNDGVLTYYVSDDDGEWDDENWSGTGNQIGNYYKITGPGDGSVGIAGTYNSVTQTFSPDSVYAGILTTFTGITTGSFSGIGTDTSVPVSWNPLTEEMLPLSMFSIIPNGGGKFITTSLVSCSTLATEISTLEDDIDTLRVGISTWLTEINTIKRRKHSYQLRIWSYKRIQARNDIEQTNIGIGTSAIYRIDPDLPTSFNTFDDNILTTFDTVNLRFDNA
jgi:hypothetical protein